MASKMIAIKEEIYNELSKLKKGNESFSDVIEDLLQLRIKKSPLAHFGSGKELNPQDIDAFETILLDKRKDQRNRRMKKLE
jgi:predicted CopG family antitoxin